MNNTGGITSINFIYKYRIQGDIRKSLHIKVVFL